MSHFKYTHAIVCRVPTSLLNAYEINLDKAKIEHENYVRTLRDLNLDVIELPADENCPLCPFVESCAFICNGMALITRPSLDRLEEVETVKSVLKKELDLPLAEIADPNARLDGSDILFTGKEFFVGLSNCTNEAGAVSLANCFPEFPCVPIKIPDNKRLKYLVTVAQEDVLCVSNSKDSQEVLKRIEREATFKYHTLTLPCSALKTHSISKQLDECSEWASNVMYVNGNIIHRSDEKSEELIEKLDIPRKVLNFSELGKCSTISSCCILVKRSKYIKQL